MKLSITAYDYTGNV